MILLDTNVLLRLAADGPLSSEALRRIDVTYRSGGTVAVSPIAFWEVATLGVKAPGTVDPNALRARVLSRGLTETPFTSDIAIAAALLGTQGFPVRDPADRFIAATAMNLGYELATTDRAILSWDGPLRCIDARP